MARMTPIERFISEIPADRRRAYDARQAKAGVKRVTVAVPEQYAEAVKLFARWLRNSRAEDIAGELLSFEEMLRSDYEAMDEDVASGRYSHEHGFTK